MATCGNYSHTRILASRLPQYHRHLSKSTLASSYSHLLLSLNSLQFTGFPAILPSLQIALPESSLLAMFSLLLVLSALDSSRGLWWIAFSCLQ